MTKINELLNPSAPYLGYRDEDMRKAYSSFFTQTNTPPRKGTPAADTPPSDSALFVGFDKCANQLSAPGYGPCETGWTVLPDGVAVVAVHTPMPEVTSEMWDWWFSWHGTEDARYKLWCPEAHLSASWQDGDGERTGLKSYIGRTSMIKEYIGPKYIEGTIRFVQPTEIGFKSGAFDGTVICGRAGEAHTPVEHSWLIHQVRNTTDGCEMRSRFYLGQEPANRFSGMLLPPGPKPEGAPTPGDLLVHCATEMNHLAHFLPKLFNKFSDRRKFLLEA